MSKKKLKPLRRRRRHLSWVEKRAVERAVQEEFARDRRLLRQLQSSARLAQRLFDQAASSVGDGAPGVTVGPLSGDTRQPTYWSPVHA